MSSKKSLPKKPVPGIQPGVISTDPDILSPKTKKEMSPDDMKQELSHQNEAFNKILVRLAKTAKK